MSTDHEDEEAPNADELSDEAAEELEARIADEELKLRERLKIEPLALEEEFVRCPSDISYQSAKYARALGEYLRCRSAQKRMRGLLLLKAYQQLRDTGGKPTESQVAAMVDQDPRWLRMRHAEDNADALREKAKGDMQAVLAKKDMLVQMGATARAEMERDPAIRDRRYVQRERG